MMTARALIEALGGTHEVATVLCVSVQAVCNMRSRGSFPPRHWPMLLRTAADRDVAGVSLKTLEVMKPENTEAAA